MSRRLVFPIVNILIVRFPNYPVWLYENWKADFEYFYVFIDSVNFFPSYPFSIELLPFSIDLCPFSMLHIIPFSLDTDPASCLIPSLNPTVFFFLSLFFCEFYIAASLWLSRAGLWFLQCYTTHFGFHICINTALWPPHLYRGSGNLSVLIFETHDSILRERIFYELGSIVS